MACIISLIDPGKQRILKQLTVYENYASAEDRVKELNKKPNKNGCYWKVTIIGI